MTTTVGKRPQKLGREQHFCVETRRNGIRTVRFCERSQNLTVRMAISTRFYAAGKKGRKDKSTMRARPQETPQMHTPPSDFKQPTG
jgi:hypothetical protein